jgi:hypothetical protein
VLRALRPERLATDTACGIGKFLGWFVNANGTTRHFSVCEKNDLDGIFSRADFIWDKQ